ncbi:hypothetical protein [Streptomyces canus]|uniref:hypothetical protein n=1 Tax=Streptomyces canus TaxID=58343 RepID=UPI002E3108DB|nr:hypothetical protein [Streptomyces canus]
MLLLLAYGLTLILCPLTQDGHGRFSNRHLVIAVYLLLQVGEPLHLRDVEHQVDGQVSVPGFIGSQ